MKRSIAILFLAVVLIMSTVVYASADAPFANNSLDISKHDVSDTPVGLQIVSQAVQRWQNFGWVQRNVLGLAQRTKVYDLGSAGYLVAPSNAKISLKTNSDGSLEPTIETFSGGWCYGDPPTTYPMTAAAFSVAAYDADGNHYISIWEALDAVNDYLYSGPSITYTQAMQVVDAWQYNTYVSKYTGPPYWSMVDTQCFSRIENNTGWIDACYKTHKLVGNLDPVYDYYQLEVSATAQSKGVWKLHAAAIRSVASTYGAPQEWVEWNPISNQPATQCGSITLGVSAGGVSISGSYTICPDEWVIAKGEAAGTFGNTWQGSAMQSARGVAYMIAVKVGECHWPVWDITPSFNCALW